MDLARNRGPRQKQAPPPRQDIACVAVVDDDDGVRKVLRNVFESANFRVVEASTEAELIAVLKSGDISIITLDLNLQHEDGLAIARTVRTFSDVPIIMVTARSDDVDRIVGLEMGADDYIVKPFNIREVVARARAVLRRTGAPGRKGVSGPNEILEIDGFEIDVESCELRTLQGDVVPTTGAEFKLLHVLARHAGRALTRDQLIDLVGGAAAAPLERSIDTLVGRLRKKIEKDSKTPRIIKTVRGVGYIFTAKPRR